MIKSSVILVLCLAFAIVVQDKKDRDKRDESTKPNTNKEIITQNRHDRNMLHRIMNLSEDSELMDEIEVSSEQRKKLKKVAVAYIRANMKLNANQMRLQAKIQSGGLSELEYEKLKLEMEEQNRIEAQLLAQTMKELKSSLLDHQFKRMEQIEVQYRLGMKNKFGDAFGVSLELAAEVGLSKNERKELEEKIAEIRKEYYRETAKLKEKAHEKILKILPKAKREKVEEILGDPYDFNKARRQLNRESKANSRSAKKNGSKKTTKAEN